MICVGAGDVVAVAVAVAVCENANVGLVSESMGK